MRCSPGWRPLLQCVVKVSRSLLCVRGWRVAGSIRESAPMLQTWERSHGIEIDASRLIRRECQWERSHEVAGAPLLAAENAPAAEAHGRHHYGLDRAPQPSVASACYLLLPRLGRAACVVIGELDRPGPGLHESAREVGRVLRVEGRGELALVVRASCRRPPASPTSGAAAAPSGRSSARTRRSTTTKLTQ